MAETGFLAHILILLAAAVITVPVLRRLGLGSVLGYLVAGAVVGPWGFGFIDEIEEIRNIAELGVVFLLFIIGIELNPARLWAMRHTVFVLGTSQVMLTGVALGGLALLFGQPISLAVIIGFGLALSSTAFGLQILTERGELGTRHGRTAFSVLLLQDLAVVPLLTMVSILAADSTMLEGVEFAILNAVLVIVFVIFAGRFLLSPILRLVATSRTPEVFTAAAMFAALGTAWLMEAVGLSLALGAFVAGLMLADSHYRHQVTADVEPFRGILLGLFFMGVGMSIDFALLGRQGVLIAGLVLGLLLVKSAIIWILCRLMKVDAADATRVSALLSQSGEFGFVVFGLAATTGVLPDDLLQLLVLLVALTMVTTPLMTSLGEYLTQHLSTPADSQDIGIGTIDVARPRVIIAGFGRVGRRIAQIIRAADVPYLAIESNADRVVEGRTQGFAAYYGDASRLDVLKTAGAEQARVLVCTLDEVAPSVRLVSILRHHYPSMPIYARARDREHCDQLLKAGADFAISESLEASLQMSGAVLDVMGVDEKENIALIESFREEYYL